MKALNELEHGRAMKVYVERADGGLWGIVVPRKATLHDLKLALRKHVALALVSVCVCVCVCVCVDLVTVHMI